MARMNWKRERVGEDEANIKDSQEKKSASRGAISSSEARRLCWEEEAQHRSLLIPEHSA